MIHKDARIGENCRISDSAYIGPKVKIGPGTEISHNAVIDGRTEIGINCRIFSGAVLGTEPQDLKYKGEDTSVIIGDNCIIREYVTVNRATAHEKKNEKGTTEKILGTTRVGKDCLLMAYTHIAHDCVVGDNAILANNATLAGHVTIEDHAILGGIVPIHQFVKIGRFAMIAGLTAIRQDIPPFCLAAGFPAKLTGLNIIGLKRNGFSQEEIKELTELYRIFFRSNKNTSQALAETKKTEIKTAPGKYFTEFIKKTERGICRE